MNETRGRRLAIALATLTGVPLAGAWAISNRVLHPRPKEEDHTLADFDLPAEDVGFASRDGTRLAGWFVPAASSPAPGIVLAHGHGRSFAELLPHARFLQRAGFAVLMFDFRSRGRSEGDAVTMGLYERGDLQAAVDALASRREVDASRIGAFGMSMGGVVTLLVAAEDERLGAVVAESPYAEHEVIMTRALRHFYHLPSFPFAPLAKALVERRLGESLGHLQPLPVVRRISPRPLLFIADGNDAVVGPEEARRLFEAAAEPKDCWFIPGADHARGWQAAQEEYERRVVAFFRGALCSAAG
jgi:hypothetical protein